MGKITLITGGARSGKSTYAEKIAKESKKQITYIATSIPFDEGMKHRIQKHREQRPKTWKTIEKYKDFHEVYKSDEYEQSQLLLVDCMTVMITNLMFYSKLDFDKCTMSEVDALEIEIIKEVNQLLDLAKDKDMIIVTNELGMGLVPSYRMGNYFRDIAGRVNQIVASRADEVYLVVCGIENKIK
ncbi:MAG: bifunctional adenosylcobinamide kinase/adenosylcobinamide-phosphate guanylyltransferase [Eubacteriaceae bacterium]